MLANWARDTTTTTGTGNLTLSAVTGYPRLSAALLVGVGFHYSIVDDSTGAPIEAGRGYLQDANTLVRERILATVVSGTFDQTAPAAVSLAAGTKRVIVSALAQSIRPPLPTIGASAGNKRLSNGAASVNLNGGFYGHLDTSGRLNIHPWYHDYGGECDAFEVQVTTAQAGAILRIGLYAPKANGDPGPLVAEGASIDLSTTGFKVGAFASSLVIPAGWYYIGLLSTATSADIDGSGASVSAACLPRTAPWGLIGGTAGAAGYALGVATTAMPNPCPGLAGISGNQKVPNVFVRPV
jgi:hypothetical protein